MNTLPPKKWNAFSLRECFSLLLLLLNFSLFSQNKIEDDSFTVTGYPMVADKIALTRFEGEFQQKSQNSFQKTLLLAQKYHWQTQQRLADGRILSLQGIDAAENPIYYITHGRYLIGEDVQLPPATATRTNTLYAGGSFKVNLKGDDLKVKDRLAIWDGGAILKTHVEFGSRISLLDNATVSDHATHVGGIMVAEGFNADARGMAFGANLKSFDYTNDLSEMSANAAALLVSNHSYGVLAGWILNTSRTGTDSELKWEWWGDPNIHPTEDFRMGYYDSKARDFDKIAYAAPYYLIVKSADNKRIETGPSAGKPYYLTNTNVTSTVARSKNDSYESIPNEANAKNIITVGAVQGFDFLPTKPADIIMSSYSSWGPTDDGRIKPDIVAVGEKILGPIATSTTSYARYTGTSVAAPNVSGALLILQEYFSKQNLGFVMRAATAKGLILHTADEAGDAPGPDYRFGWGLLNVEKAARVIENANYSNLISEKSLSNGSTAVTKVTATGTEPLRVTISWTDPEGNLVEMTKSTVNDRNPKLINDLDIRISDGTSTFTPWILDPAKPPAAATHGDNFRDNVEQILIENPVANRTYTITVSHKGALKTGAQNYSLIISGITKNNNCQLTAALLPDGDPIICPNSSLKLQANTGTNYKYEWYWNSQLIPNANAATYTTNTAGTYIVKVLQDNCSAFSQSLLITTSTLQARAIADGTTNLCNGGTAKLIANTGTNLQYQWLKDGVAVATATQSTFTAREKGNYVVNVTQGKCAVKSAAIAVTASGAVPLSPISPSTDITNCDGKAITIATNTDATYKYQWTKDGKNISNATLYNYGALQTGTYQVVVTNSQCYSVSPSVKLNFGGVQANIAPEVAKILTQPNKAVTFYASAGSGLTYQWLKNGNSIANATAHTYATAIEGTYSVRVTNNLCSAVSIGVLLVVGSSTNKVNGVAGDDGSLFLDLFPNPVESQLTVRFYADSVLTEDPRIEIYNILGSKMHESTLQSSQVEQEFKTDLDVSQWLTGAYFIRVFTREKAISKGFMKK